ncbi:MAG: hypothetical protein FJ272_16410, partial [Planctomycetes bacterium]|nr:hypothetical protein [Planctomycetota bacterium]
GTTENELYVVKNRPFLNADNYLLHQENLYIEPVLTLTTLYTSEFKEERKYLVPRGHTHVKVPDYDRIVARDLTRPAWKALEARHISYGQKQVKMPRLEFPVLWALESPLRVLIKAGDRLYAGGKSTVAAVAIPKKGEVPRVAWQAEIDGTPVHALVADGKLVVATDSGRIFCFGRGPKLSDAPRKEPAAYRSPEKGYALLLGWGDGTRARAVGSTGERRVVVLEPDAAKASDARQALAQDGLYGRQAQVIQGVPGQMRLTPYWASLVVAESAESEAALAMALDALRPYDGELLLPGGQGHADALKRLLAVRTGYAAKLDGQDVTVRRESPPDGAADWTHEMGGPGNTYAGSDRLVKWPLGVLWYSGDIDRYFTPASHFQHERHPYPLVVGGRMFFITGQVLHAVDIYTGNYLWRAEMPMTPWVRTRFFDSRIYGRPTERNCVAAEDWGYAVTGEQIHAYDAAAGKLVKVLDIPASLREQAQRPIHKPQEERYMGFRAEVQGAPQWTEVRLWRHLLLAMLGRQLVALDRHSGEVRWTRQSTRETTTYALGGDTLFGLDCDVPEIGGGLSAVPGTAQAGKGGKKSGLLFAMNPETGKVSWEKALEYDAVPPHKVEYPRLWVPPVIPDLSYNAKHGLIVMAVNRNDLHVFASDGTPVWSKTDAPKGDVQRTYA